MRRRLEPRPIAPAWRWLIAAAGAFVIALAAYLINHHYSARVPSKGHVAWYTVRAPADAVVDLHHAAVDEALDAKERYVPIYEVDSDLLYRAREAIVTAALARPVDQWAWPVLDSAPDAGVAIDARRAKSTPVRDQEAPASDRFARERRADIEALFRGLFRLLEPIYARGVIADNEFPNEQDSVRLLRRGMFEMRPVGKLHRFSDVAARLTARADDFFFKIDPAVRKQAIDFILARLPANLVYAEENRRFIGDISQVTGVKLLLIRRGDILVRVGEVVDGRAELAIKASLEAARGVGFSPTIAAFALLAILFAGFAVVVETMRPSDRALADYLVAVAGTTAIAPLGLLSLYLAGHHPLLIPHLAMPLLLATVSRKRFALTSAVVSAGGTSVVCSFDVTMFIAAAAASIVAALLVRPRQRTAVLGAAVVAGLVQALVYQAGRVLAMRPQTSEELLVSTQAFVGGAAAGLLALLILPAVQRLVGQASLSDLRSLSDFTHPLVEKMRAADPEYFARTLRVLSAAEAGAQAIHADVSLVRVGALMQGLAVTRGHAAPQANEGEAAVAAFVDASLAVAVAARLPREVVRLIGEHRGRRTLVDGTTVGWEPRSAEGLVLRLAIEMVGHGKDRRDAHDVVQELLVSGALRSVPLPLISVETAATAISMTVPVGSRSSL